MNARRVHRALRRRRRIWSLRGDAVRCPVCDHSFRRFADAYGEPEVVCAWCGSHHRHRALWLYLRDEVKVAERRIRVLHFAAEWSLRRRLRPLDNLDYLTAGLDDPDVDAEADLTDLPFGDGAFDLVVCSHVLEHVDDDRAAILELGRVTAAGGATLVMVPVDYHRTETFEDPAIVEPAERERAYWRHDHVRLYSPDVVDRLAAGFEVERVRMWERLGAAAARRAGLMEVEEIFVCRPAATAARRR